MNWIRILPVVITLALCPGWAADQKPQKKLTCCEKAFSEGKECRNKCCLTAHRAKKSCEKCNPGKEDLAIIKKLAEKQQNKTAPAVKN